MGQDMRHIGVRLATEQDKDKLLNWLMLNAKRNAVDYEVLTFPATSVLCAYYRDSGEPVLFLPVQQVPMLESLAPAPDASELDMAWALEKIFDAVSWSSRSKGQGECYFLGSDEATNRVAEKHGFKKAELPVYRMKL